MQLWCPKGGRLLSFFNWIIIYGGFIGFGWSSAFRFILLRGNLFFLGFLKAFNVKYVGGWSKIDNLLHNYIGSGTGMAGVGGAGYYLIC